MATFADSLANEMAQNFSKGLEGADSVDLSDDKTLKWRSLLNNKYASASAKRGAGNKKSPSHAHQDPSQTLGAASSTGASSTKHIASGDKAMKNEHPHGDDKKPVDGADGDVVVVVGGASTTAANDDATLFADVDDNPKRVLRRKPKQRAEQPSSAKKFKKYTNDGLESDEATGKYNKRRAKRGSDEHSQPKALRLRRSDRKVHQPVMVVEPSQSGQDDGEEDADEDEAENGAANKDTDEKPSLGIREAPTSEPHCIDSGSDLKAECNAFADGPPAVAVKMQRQSSDEDETKNVASFVMTVLGDEAKTEAKTNDTDIKDEMTEKVLDPVPSTDASTPDDSPSSQQEPFFPVASSHDIKVPKKRGRKPGYKKLLNPFSGATKKSARISRDHDSDPAFDPAHKLTSSVGPSELNNAAPSQRLSRRIKPTPKILANDELRLGFEVQNSARLSLSSENLDAEKSPLKDTQPMPAAHTTAQIFGTAATPPPQPLEKPRLPLEFSPRRRAPCPDPVEFLNAIKLEKINLNRSPEDNKKMSIKQRKRLLKLKEKHFQKLGLQRSRIGYAADSSHDSTELDEEDFVPNCKVSVGRPNVTLRLRANTNTQDAPPPPPLKSNRRSFKYHVSSVKKRVYTVIPKHETSLILSTKHKHAPPQVQRSTAAATQLNENQPRNLASDPTTICLCAQPSKYYTQRTADTAHCRAIDEIESQLVGCCNEMPGGDLLNLRRPSVRVKYSLLCAAHVQRLVAHQSCAGCGVFCTQGTFVVCPRSHLFHKDCATKFILNAPFSGSATDFVCPTLVLRCPHCGVDAPDKETRVTMRCRTVPVFLPYQRQPPKMARMSIGQHTHASGAVAQQRSGAIGQKQFLWELEKLIPPAVMDVVLRAQEVAVNGLQRERQVGQYRTKDIFEAINADNVVLMAKIIASGFDISAPLAEFRRGSCLHLVSNFGSLAMAYLILSRSPSIDFLNRRDRELRSALMCTVLGAKNDVLRMLVQCGADVTLRGPGGMTALHLAAKTGNFTAAQIILDAYRRATSATAFGMFVNAVDDGGWTTIVWAAEIGHSDMVEYLVQCGADLSVCDAERNTVMHWAALSDDLATVRPLLLEADLNVQNVNGDTPLHIACRNSNTRMCLMFLAHGASLELQNDLGETAFDGIGDEHGACAKAVLFNIKLRALARFGEHMIVCQDISKGREVYPIKVIKRRKQASNAEEQDLIDDDELPHFIYITQSIILQSSIQIDRRISQMRVCACADNCTSSGCQCSEISVQNWYNAEGRLHGTFNFADPAMIFECNDVCGCNKLQCKNRVVQNGQKVALQVVECGGAKGWGVTAVGDVARGTFIAEYTGEILTDAEADRRIDDSFFFDLDSSKHCIDAHYYGNVSRFFNHSCSPNVVPIRVYYDHQDLRFPKIAFFAVRDICADEEITFDYGEKFWLSKNKSFPCECAAESCRFSSRVSPVSNSVDLQQP